MTNHPLEPTRDESLLVDAFRILRFLISYGKKESRPHFSARCGCSVEVVETRHGLDEPTDAAIRLLLFLKVS
jgi:hypothetical protein